ncbi:MAG: hypothetical protein M0R80_01890 [Proteobacteria bacterium]|jgi:hypothetical protein|nr:hypothetical protein [Pseudomonadota bacterium]
MKFPKRISYTTVPETKSNTPIEILDEYLHKILLLNVSQKSKIVASRAIHELGGYKPSKQLFSNASKIIWDYENSGEIADNVPCELWDLIYNIMNERNKK